MADRGGRRKVFIATSLNVALATGITALTPDRGGWLFLSLFRFFVGFGNAGFWFLGIETRGRSIEEIDGALGKPEPATPRFA